MFGTELVSAVISAWQKLQSLFPALSQRSVQHTWTGVLGVSRDWCTAVNFDRGSGIGSAGGYVGHGRTGTNLDARTLRDLIPDRDTDTTRLPGLAVMPVVGSSSPSDGSALSRDLSGLDVAVF